MSQSPQELLTQTRSGPALNRERMLKQSKNFCMMPWTHMHFWPTGEIFPCCLADTAMPLGHYGEPAQGGISIEEAWNSERMRQIRRNMLEDKPSAECSRCYLLEENSQTYTLRLSSNATLSHHWDKVESTRPDGSVPQVNMAYLDIRFSNLCNFRCQTCGPLLSSSWYEDQTKLFGKPEHPKVLRINPTESFWSELEPLLLGVENAYFAGGEPLISEEIYRILDYWLEHGKTSHPITFTTNFSQLVYRGKNILDYWAKFPKVTVAASLDAAGPRGEYLRKGTDWKRIERNRAEMMERCPKTKFEITPTISAYNVLHFPDFHLDWIERGLMQANSLRLNLLSYPSSMSIRILPEPLKREVEKKYQRTLDLLLERGLQEGMKTDNIESGYRSVLSFIRSGEDQKEISGFLERARIVDEVRGESFSDAIPELKPLLQSLRKAEPKRERFWWFGR